MDGLSWLLRNCRSRFCSKRPPSETVKDLSLPWPNGCGSLPDNAEQAAAGGVIFVAVDLNNTGSFRHCLFYPWAYA